MKTPQKHRFITLCSVAILALAVLPACSKKEEPAAPKTNPAAGTGLSPADSTKTTALGRALDSAHAIAATQLTAGQLEKLYTPQLEALKTGLSSVQNVAKVDSSLLTGETGSTYQELAAMVPELTDLVNSLKNYEKDGTTDLATKLQDGFAKAQDLYARLQKQLQKAK